MSPHHSATPNPAKSSRQRRVPFIDHLQIVVESAQDGKAQVSLELRPELLNNHAGGHGGVVTTVLDCAMAHAALSRVDYTREVVTIDMHLAFMRPSTGRIVAVGRATGGGKSVCFCEAHILNADGELTAQAMGTFRYRDIA